MDWTEFRKLFKVPIPVPEHAEYYIKTLAKSPKYEHLPNLVESFREFENRCADGVRKEKLKALDRLVEFLRGTCAYKNMMEYEPQPTTTHDIRHICSKGEWLVGLDLKAANFNVFRSMGLPFYYWEDLCKECEVDPFLMQSKSFRQVVFGNLNPKRNQKIQAEVMDRVKGIILDVTKCDIVYQSHDELLFEVHPAILGDTLDSIHTVLCTASFPDDSPDRRRHHPTRVFVQRRFHLGEKKQYRIDHYDPNERDGHKQKIEYSSLLGVPGNRFFMAFKEHILFEPLEEPDYLFLVDGKIAKWEE